MTFGKRFRKERTKLGLTQHDVAVVAGVRTKQVFRWEHDLALPRWASLKAVADLFDIPVETMLEWASSEAA